MIKYYVAMMFYFFMSASVWARGGDGDSGSGEINLWMLNFVAANLHSNNSRFRLLLLIGGCVFYAMVFVPWYISRQVKSKNKKITQALKLFEQEDSTWNEKQIIESVRQCFISCQNAWSKQDLPKLQSLMLPEIYELWENEIKNQKKLNQVNSLKNLNIEEIIIVDAENRIDDEKDRFTAYIQATVEDEMLQNGSPISNSVNIHQKRSFIFFYQTIEYQKRRAKNGRFREFWSFEWENGEWLVRNITPLDGWKRFVNKKIIREVYYKK